MWAWVCVLCSSAWSSQMAPGANLLLLLSYTHSYLSCVYSDISSDQSFYTLLSEVRRTQGVLELTVHADLLTQWHIFSHSSILSTAFLEPITWANYCWAHKGQRSMLHCTDSSICSDCVVMLSSCIKVEAAGGTLISETLSRLLIKHPLSVSED